MFLKSKKFSTGIIYLTVLISLTLVRILFTAINYSDNFSDLLFTFLSQIICMGIIPLILYFAFNYRNNLYETNIRMKNSFGYKKSDNRQALLITVIIAITFIFITRAVSIFNSVVINLIGFVPTSGPSVIYSNIGDLFIDLIFTAVLPAIFEEFTHRGVLLSGLKDECGERNAIIISALLFALMHQNIQQFLYTFAGGLILGFLTVTLKSIYPAMFIHFFNNAWSVLSSYSSQKGGIINFIENFFFLYSEIFGYALMIIVYLLAFYLTYRYLRKSYFHYKLNNPFILRVRYSKELNLALNSPLYAAVLLGALATIFTLVWGILR